MKRGLLDFCVIDALAQDVDQLEEVVWYLNSGLSDRKTYHPEPFVEDEVAPALIRGIQDGLIMASVLVPGQKSLTPLGDGVVPEVPLDEVWFGLTQRGWLLYQNWFPFGNEEDEAS